MGITHVIRGDDHISNTPKQILLYEALGVPLPVFAHVPMILGPDGRRLSKRHGATAIGEYRDRGILADAMVNFLALLGWSPGTDEEIFSRAELVARFGLDGINRKSAIFDTQKLEWMNGRYLARLPAADLVPAVRSALGSGAPPEPEDWWVQVVELLKVRARTVREMVEMTAPFIGRDVAYDAAAVAKHWKDPATTADRLERLRARLAAMPAFEAAPMEQAVRSFAEEEGLGAGKVIHPLRVALTGTGASPGIFEVAMLLGRDRMLHRLDAAVQHLRNSARLDAD
jgi:glutamyl-tRNA synthetase